MPRVLVVDDDAMACVAVEACFQRQGLEVTVADGGDAGICALESSASDVILVDVFMPHGRGFESIRVFDERGPTIHLIAISDYAFTNLALAHVDSGQPFDLMFTDLVMPGGMTGRQLADEVSRRRPGTKVLYTSGYADNAIVHHGRLDEGVMLLSKPYRKSKLAQMVRQALEAN